MQPKQSISRYWSVFDIRLVGEISGDPTSFFGEDCAGTTIMGNSVVFRLLGHIVFVRQFYRKGYGMAYQGF